VGSHRKAAAAQRAGRFARSMIPVRAADGQIVLESDESIRPNTSVEAMAKLEPLVDAKRAEPLLKSLRAACPQVGEVVPVHHAGNAPGVVDGASLALLATEEGAARLGLRARGRIRAY